MTRACFLWVRQYEDDIWTAFHRFIPGVGKTGLQRPEWRCSQSDGFHKVSALEGTHRNTAVPYLRGLGWIVLQSLLLKTFEASS